MIITLKKYLYRKQKNVEKIRKKYKIVFKFMSTFFSVNRIFHFECFLIDLNWNNHHQKFFFVLTESSINYFILFISRRKPLYRFHNEKLVVI